MKPEDPFDQPGTVGELLCLWVAQGWRSRWSLGPKGALTLVTVIGLLYSVLIGEGQGALSDQSAMNAKPQRVRYDKLEDWGGGEVVVYKHYDNGVTSWTVDWESKTGIIKRLAGPKSSYPRVRLLVDGRLAVRIRRSRTRVPGGWETHIASHVWKSAGDPPELIQSKMSNAPIDHRKLSSNALAASDLELDEAIVGVEGLIKAGKVGH